MSARKLFRWSLIVVAALVLLAVGVLALLPQLLDTPTMHAYIAQTAAHALGRPVKVSGISVSLLPLPNVKLKGLEVADDPRFGTAPMLRVGEVRVGVRVRPLLSLRIELASLTLEEARVELVESGGRWNVASLAPTSVPAKPAARSVPGIPGSTAMGSVMVSRVRLKDAVVHVRRQGVKNSDLEIDRINATVSGLGGSELDIRGDGRMEPGGLLLQNIRASVGMRGAGEMPLKASLDVEGADIGPLVVAFLAPSPALSGPLKGKIQLSGTPARLSATGAIDLSRLTVSEERGRCASPGRRQLVLDAVHVPVLFKPTAFESAPLSAKLGKGTLAAKLTAGLEPPALMTFADIKLSGVELRPILQDYLCQDFAVTGPLDLGGDMSMRMGDPWKTMNGSGRFKVGAGQVVGAGALKLVRDVLEASGVLERALRGKLSASGKTALDFDSITGSYRITNGVARTDDLVYQSKDMKVTAVGTYGLADGRTDMNVVVTQGTSQLRARVTGSGGSLNVIPTGVKVKEPEEVKKFLDRLLR